jgi:hypothetical protein
MTDPERIEALLGLFDPTRSADLSVASRLAVMGLAERHRIGFRPTQAGGCS